MGPEVLRDRAKQVLSRFDIGRNAVDSGVVRARLLADALPLEARDVDEVAALDARVASAGRVHLPRARGGCWPRPGASTSGAIDLDDPPHEVSGMASVMLDGAGHLNYLRVVPPQIDSIAAAGTFSGGGCSTKARLPTRRSFRAAPR